MIGRILGNYRIVEKIGEGGMGAVYRAVDLMLEREVAIKAIRPELSREPQIVERFRAEARTLARVSHPAIANVYAFFYEEDELFLALEFVRGRTLSRVLQEGGAIPWQSAVQLLASAMEGIEQAHRTGIVHRDLKPDNLMLTEAGTLKVMDFGIARVMGSGHLTRTGLLVGTLRYMSPEQIQGEEVDGRTDVYALGAVLYEMLTGHTPFEGASDYAILRAQIEDNPRPPGEHVPTLPWWLDRAVLKSLAKQPAERFQTVDEMRLCMLRQGETQQSVLPAAAGAAGAAAIADLPTLVTPPGGRRLTPPPAPPGTPPPAGPGHTTAASPGTPRVTLPVPAPPGAAQVLAAPALPTPPPAPTSYRPVELGRKGAGNRNLVIAAAAIAVFLGLAATGIWLLASFLGKRGQAADATQPATAAQQGGPADAPASPSTAAGKVPSATYQPPAPLDATPSSEPAATPPKVLPPRTLPPVTGPAPAPPEPVAAPDAGEQPAATPAPEGATPGDIRTPAEEEPPIGPLPFQQLHHLAADINARSAELVDKYKDFLSKKENAGSELTQSDQQLRDNLAEFQDAAETFDKQFQVGRWGRMFGHRADDQLKTRENFRRLATLGAQVERLMNEVRPGPEVRQAWLEVRKRWRHAGRIVAGL